MADKTRYVICYDIPDDKRRGKIAKVLDGYGDRVQFSVFEAVLDRAVLDEVIAKVSEVIEPAEDRVLVFCLCAACEKKRLGLGLAAHEDAPCTEEVFIV